MHYWCHRQRDNLPKPSCENVAPIGCSLGILGRPIKASRTKKLQFVCPRHVALCAAGVQYQGNCAPLWRSGHWGWPPQTKMAWLHTREHSKREPGLAVSICVKLRCILRSTACTAQQWSTDTWNPSKMSGHFQDVQFRPHRQHGSAPCGNEAPIG